MPPFEAVQSTRFPGPFAFDCKFPLFFAFFTLFGKFVTDGDGLGVDDVFTLFAEVSKRK